MRSEVNKVRLTVLIALLFSALCAGVFRTPPILFMAALLTSAPFVGLLLGRLSNRSLQIHRTLPEVGTVGDVVTGEISISNHARWPAFLVHTFCGLAQSKTGFSRGLSTLRAAVVPTGSDRQVVPMLRGLSRATWQQQWLLQQRGVHSVSPAQAGVLDPLGLASRLPIHTAPQQITVLPRPVRLEQLGVLGGAGLEQQQPRHSTSVADAMDFHGVRPWIPGEAIRRAHWKYTARTGQLHVIEWEESPATDLALLLDVQAQAVAGDELDNTLETAITAAASIATYLLENGCRVQLLYFARERTGAPSISLRNVEAHSVQGIEAVLSALAEVEAIDSDAASVAHLREAAYPLVARGLGTLIIASSRATSGNSFAETSSSHSNLNSSNLLLVDAESFEFRKKAPSAPDGKLSNTHPAAAFPSRRRPSRRAGIPLLRRGEPIAAVLEGR